MSVGAMVNELCIFSKKEKKKNMVKRQNLFFVIILPKSGILLKDLAHSLVLTCVVL